MTSVDQYVDSLGGISRSIARAKGVAAPVYIGDQTQGEGKVRTLGEQVALETRTRMLNPSWTEGMLASGFEGVRQIEVHMTNTMGWSATTGEVAPWVYQRISETYVLDDTMRNRLADLNPKAALRVASRLLEAHDPQLLATRRSDPCRAARSQRRSRRPARGYRPARRRPRHGRLRN